MSREQKPEPSLVNFISEFECANSIIWGAQWRSWLRHCGTIWKVAGSIPDVVIGIFIDIILPAALWPQGNSASKRKKYQEYFMGVKAAGA